MVSPRNAPRIFLIRPLVLLIAKKMAPAEGASFALDSTPHLSSRPTSFYGSHRSDGAGPQ